MTRSNSQDTYVRTNVPAPAIRVRKANDRGTTEAGWLHSRHSFSFNMYYDPEHMGFRSLRVINDDFVDAATGFGTHPHRDMEIITIMLDGSLMHRDSLGHEEPLRPGEVQTMSAGTGIRHSEYNASPDKSLHLLQIWIEPEQLGLAPKYQQKAFDPAQRVDRFQRVAGRDDTQRDGALPIHQDADVLLATLTVKKKLEYALRQGRGAWVHIVRGEVTVSGQALSTGDAIALENVSKIELQATAPDTEVLLFDLA